MISKAIFLDRDGVLIDNSEHYYIWRNDQLRFVEGVFDNLKYLIQKDYQLFIVSNQGGISKGLYAKNDVFDLHNQLMQTFGKNNIPVTDFVFCPHHPEIEKCICRKPNSVMIEKLLAKYQLNREESWFIGDSQSDIEAAGKVGIQSIKIQANSNMYPYISKLI